MHKYANTQIRKYAISSYHYKYKVHCTSLHFSALLCIFLHLLCNYLQFSLILCISLHFSRQQHCSLIITHYFSLLSLFFTIIYHYSLLSLLLLLFSIIIIITFIHYYHYYNLTECTAVLGTPFLISDDQFIFHTDWKREDFEHHNNLRTAL